jgi:hypothetical protein
MDIINLINQKKDQDKLNRQCKFCHCPIQIKRACISCTMKINNFKLKETGYFKQYHKENYQKVPIELQKKRGRKPKPKDQPVEQ